MKIYIAFSGIITICLMAICFQGDMKVYEHEQWLFKEISEEAAAGAALYIDEDAYSEGLLVFEYEKGTKYAEKYLEESKKNSYILKEANAKIELEFEDDKCGYSKENTDKTPTVIAKISATHKDIFRLPFLTANNTQRESSYELKEIQLRN